MKSRNRGSTGADITRRGNIAKADLLSFIQSQWIDQTADYLQRGREHAHLADGSLFETWERAFRAMAEASYSAELRSTETDLRAEIELRGLHVPYDAVTDAMDKFISESDKIIKTLTKDSEEFDRIDDELTRDIIEHRERRDRSRN